ncbi:aldo/keto reductase [Lactobacillus sp.]|uniref:aldo/keto reductase n=1 Tax=Lactobacillus sp. TaxID=1591 RepID=UPI0019AC680C|nr:aldo/keto reductase [Lactobacillus sp.]MBD5429205.1 aldo/keto reductase [Lactobacillus sp.]
MTEVTNIFLNDGNQMPQLGFGVFQIPDHNEAKKAVEEALSNGYRLIDTAEAYNNQKAVGEAIKDSSVKREDIFLTTKLWVSNYTFEKATKAIDEDLKELGTDYIDLMLLHQPYGDVYGAWDAMQAAQRAGKIKSIGVSNFAPDQYMNLELEHEVSPAINQIEINPWFQQTNDVKYFQGRDIAVEAWAPFAEGKDNIFSNKTLKAIGEKYDKTVGQVILRWLIQRSIVVIPKSVHSERQKENMDIFDFQLSQEDMKQIAGLDKGVSQFFDHRDPAVIDDIFGESLKQLRHS